MSLTRALTSSLLAGIVLLTLLAGCGKRGPLYMPGERDSQQSEQTEPAAPAQDN